jgi:acetyl-CoA acetyltransferase
MYLGNSIDSILKSSPAKNAARQAYDMARIKPSHIDLAEIHDAFSILEIMAYEELGFVGAGKGGRFIDKKDQDVYINPRGGILGCGHPLGATGIAQTVEIFKQLSGTIDDNNNLSEQLKFFRNGLYNENNSLNAKTKKLIVPGRQIKSDIQIGLVHNLAAAGTSASILILEK